MSLNIIKTVKNAISNLNPQEIRDEAERKVRIGLHAESEQAYRRMENFFMPATLSAGRREETRQVVLRAGFSPGETKPMFDIEVYSQGVGAPPDGFVFSWDNPAQSIDNILRTHPKLAIALARRVPPFRLPVAHSLVKQISRENALFALATAIPDIMPFISLPWALGELASDTAVLTANQIRLAFMLGAASDRAIGYTEQRGEVASILLGALGFRSLARELVGKIPFGGGLIPKAAIAYAGTRVAGLSLERYYRIGYHYTRQERERAYGDAIKVGRAIAGSIMNRGGFKRLAGLDRGGIADRARVDQATGIGASRES